MTATDRPLVLKFGGTSVGTPERIQNVARLIRGHRASYEKIVVVVSAMADTTDDLIELAAKVSPGAARGDHRREMDMLLTAGERISMSLVSMALADLGVAAISLTGSQTGIVTDTVHGEARIHEIRPIRIPEIFAAGKVAIVAGFQGVSLQKEITTLGRGGSDTSAVALACALGASEARIFTDVDGVFSADPRRIKSARLWPELSWDLTIEAAYRGAQVLHPRCVELGRAYGMPIRVINSFQDAGSLDFRNPGGTLIYGDSMNQNLEGPQIKLVTVKKNCVDVERACADAVDASNRVEALRAQTGKIDGSHFQGGKLVVSLAHEDWSCVAAHDGFAPVGEPYDLVSLLGVGLTAERGLSDGVARACQKLGVVVREITVTSQRISLKAKAGSGDSLLEPLHALMR